jgi:uroporphyrin-III C-methyltransferase
MVSIVGAGPGDPGLITVRGLRALRVADVVVYDRLVARELLVEAPRAAERIYAGKVPGCHTLAQAAINTILIGRARRGLRVVRLKGGDPFLFGRGGEEAQALTDAGVTFEVIPGVSSAFAVPAAAGIPVTHRDVSSSVTIVSGHDGRAEIDPDGTLVILMGVSKLEIISCALIAGGRSKSTPAAVIQDGTTQHQLVVTGTLADIAQRATLAGVRSPAIIVIGAVAAFARETVSTVRETVIA